MSTLDVKELCDLYGLNARFEHLECDGLTWVLSYVLSELDVDHRVAYGSVEHGGKRLGRHLWIEYGPDLVIDYRLDVWFPEPARVPIGIFHPLQYAEVKYAKRGEFPPRCEKWLFELLTDQDLYKS